MEFLTTLWLPILVAAIFVFIASAIIWMATPLHKKDYKDPGQHEGPLLAAVRSAAFQPGLYYMPWCQPKDRNDPAVQARTKAGPWVLLTVMPGQPNMGKTLGLWFLHLVVVSIFIAYVADLHLSGTTAGMDVLRTVGTIAFLAYAGYAMPMAIWHGMPWSQVPGKVLDGLVYALVTGGTFAWLWPTV